MRLMFLYVGFRLVVSHRPTRSARVGHVASPYAGTQVLVAHGFTRPNEKWGCYYPNKHIGYGNRCAPHYLVANKKGWIGLREELSVCAGC